MNNFTFYSPTEFVFGKGTETQTGTLAREHGATKVMIVYGGGSAVRSGLLDRVKLSLRQAGMPFCEMGGVQPNPTDGKVYEGIALCRNEKADMLLAVGGGSVIDTAKAIAAGVPYEGDFWDFFAGKATVEKALKVAVVLTIPAAGSEGSGNSVITKADTLQKPCGVTDMMAHIMERYFTNTTGVEVADRMCEGVLMSIIEEAPKAMAAPNDYDARANLMWAGMVAHNGTCGTGCEEDWASHFLEHEVSALYGVTHGAGLAVIFPAWMKWMAAHHPRKIAQYAHRVWHVAPSADSRADALQGITCLQNFLRQLGMPLDLKELGVPHPDIDLLAHNLHLNKGELVGNYVRLTEADSREIYHIAMG